METLYGITKQEAKVLLNHCENNVETLALILWNIGKVGSLESGIKKAKKLKNFSK